MNNKGQMGIILAIVIVVIIVGLFGVAFYFVYTSDDTNSTSTLFSSNGNSDNFTAVVTNVYNGDTIQIDNKQNIGLLCVKAPTEKEYLYIETTQLLQKRLLNKTIVVEREKNYKSDDKAYVWLDGQLLNQNIVKNGLAHYNKDVDGSSKYCDAVYQGELIAQSFYQGIWGQKQNEGQVME